MLLLDTCTLLWLAAEQDHLSANAKKAIRQNSEGLFVSSISAFEIALKVRRGKLALPLEAVTWFEKVLKQHGIQEIPVTYPIATRSVTLPPLHNDPCDRFIIATACEHCLAIITSDTLISQYQEVKVIW